MQQAAKTTQGTAAILLWKLAAAGCVIIVAMKLHAAVTINFSSTINGTNRQSDNTAMDGSFTFELGTFDTTVAGNPSGTWAPTAGNVGEWASRWNAVTDPTGSTVPEASVAYGPVPFIFGPYDGFNSNVLLEHNNTPFQAGERGYIWGFNSQTGNAEWILLSRNADLGDPWTYPDTSGVPFTETWSVGTANDVIVGNANFTNGGGEFIAMQSAEIKLGPAVPEPSTTLLIGTALAAAGLRRRRRPPR